MVCSSAFSEEIIQNKPSQTSTTHQVAINRRGSGWSKFPKKVMTSLSDAVDGWNPTNQLRLVIYSIIHKVLAPSQVVIAGFLNHQQWFQSFNPIFNIETHHPNGFEMFPQGWILKKNNVFETTSYSYVSRIVS